MRSLALKLTLAFLLVSVTGIPLVAILAGQITAREFRTYTETRGVENARNWLADYYDSNGSWQGVGAALDRTNARGRRGQDGQPGRPMPQLLVAAPDGLVLTAAGGYDPGDRLPADVMQAALEVEVDGRTVGVFVPSFAAGEVGGGFAGPRWNDLFRPPPTTDFTARVNRLLTMAALAATILSLLLGVFLARTLVQPLRELQEATQAVATGDLTRQVPVRSQDELGELAQSFNQMSTALARSRNQRRQMTADIAHDLRTPLSVITGHAEGLSDGVLPANQETFDIILDEAQRLGRLVEDLRTLSLAEANELSLQRQPTDPADLLKRAVAAYTPRAKQKQIDLTVDVAPHLSDVDVDPDRMGQVLANLLHNALRYTPSGGQVTLSARRHHRALEIAVQDSGPGIPPADLVHVFDRFYRGDKSRQRHEGGSGLGLAIAKSIVESHGGTIRAENGTPAGARFVISLPSV